MQVANLSKTVNLLIVGVFFIANCLVLNILYLPERSAKLSDQLKPLIESAFASIVFGVAMISVAIFFGLLVESLTERCRKLIFLVLRKDALSRVFSIFFLNRKSQSGHDYWRDMATKLKKEIYPNSVLLDDKIRGFFTARMFTDANASFIGWITRHYATYLLASNFALILIFNLVLFAIYFSPAVILLHLALIYLLVVIAIDKYFYSYEGIYRFAYTTLLKEKAEFSNLDTKPAPKTGMGEILSVTAEQIDTDNGKQR